MPQQNDYIVVNWSPYATNPIDHVDGRPDRRMLVTPKGEEVTITQSISPFISVASIYQPGRTQPCVMS